MKNRIFLLFVILSLIGCSPSPAGYDGEFKAATMSLAGFSKGTTAKKAKNVIFLIGDGMGISQVSAAAIKNNNKLFIKQFPVIGIHNPQLHS